MILVGSQRGGSMDLAQHLLKEENEHIEVHELRGFVAQDLKGALNEVDAISKGTRCRQFLFSVSFNPPKGEKASTADFEDAIERVEMRLGLSGQPRAIVFHEKKGRRHAHAVWSRIDMRKMKAVQMSYYRNRLNAISRELYLEHDWDMPRGLTDKSLADPKNYTLADYQQAQRIGKDVKAINRAFEDAWAISDSKSAFINALEERGYKLARGDRRGFVAVDWRGEVFSISRKVGVKPKELHERLGDENELRSVDEVREQIAHEMTPAIARHQQELDRQAGAKDSEFKQRRRELVNRQRRQRKAQAEKIKQRRLEEAKARQARFRRGLKGLWDRMRGEHRRIRLLNEQEVKDASIRDRAEKDELIFSQLSERRQLDVFRLHVREEFQRERDRLRLDADCYRQMHRESIKPAQPGNVGPRIRGPTPER